MSVTHRGGLQCPPRPTSSRARWTATPGLRARPGPAGRHPRDRRRRRSPRASRFADDLDADSLALIELVEALEEELGERTVGFRIEDEDLEDLKTVRDAVDYVYARVERLTLSDGPGPRGAERASGSATTFHDPALLRQAARPPLLVRRARRATRPTSASSSSATPCSAGSSPTSPTARYTDLPEGELTDVRKARRERRRAGRGGRRARARRRPAARQGRGRRRRAAEALDPGRRPRGRHRRRLPRRRLAPAPRPRRAACSATASPRRSSGLAVTTTRPACRSWPPACSTRAPSTPCGTRGPTTPSASSPRCCVDGRRAGATARAGRRSRPSRPRPGRRARDCWRSTRPSPCLSCPRSRPSAATSTGRSAGKRVKAVRGHRRRAPCAAATHDELDQAAGRPQGRSRPSGGASTCCRARLGRRGWSSTWG